MNRPDHRNDGTGVADRGWTNGYIQPEPPQQRGKKGCGGFLHYTGGSTTPNRAGHTVVVYERSDEPGGLLTYGIPNFKLDKQVVFRRVEQMEAEGVEFRCGAEVGVNVPVAELKYYDAVLIAIGSTKPRTFEGMNVPGWNL